MEIEGAVMEKKTNSCSTSGVVRRLAIRRREGVRSRWLPRQRCHRTAAARSERKRANRGRPCVCGAGQFEASGPRWHRVEMGSVSRPGPMVRIGSAHLDFG